MPQPSLSGLDSERARIDRVRQRLGVTDDPAERADLGSELVRAVARYEDTVERAVHPRLAGVAGPDELERLERDRHALRDAMTEVQERTAHIDPRNVHASDPEGFERALGDVLESLERFLPDEDRALAELLERSTPSEREELERDVERAASRASERPHPPRTALGRALANAEVKLDHTFEDVATPHHPGAPIVDDPEETAPS